MGLCRSGLLATFTTPASTYSFGVWWTYTCPKEVVQSSDYTSIIFWNFRTVLWLLKQRWQYMIIFYCKNHRSSVWVGVDMVLDSSGMWQQMQVILVSKR